MPALLVLAVVGEEVHDELVDLGQGAHLRVVVLDGHGDQTNVRVGGLSVRHIPSVRARS